jgi:RHS repeat-associated protein
MLAKLSGSSIYYFHQDALGSTRLVTTGSTTSYSSNYLPFGPQYGASGSDPIYKYTDKPQDAVTGLYYFGARYYNTSIGRFISRDPAAPQPKDPQSLNPYAYARNNPERLTDPTGAFWVSQWNQWGWTCVAWFWGWCTFAIPYWIFHAAVGIGALAVGIDVNVFGASGNIWASLGPLPGQDWGAFGLGVTAGNSLLIAAFVAISIWGWSFGGYLATMIISVGVTLAILAENSATSNPVSRLSFYFGLLLATLTFFSLLIGASVFGTVFWLAVAYGFTYWGQLPWGLGVLLSLAVWGDALRWVLTPWSRPGIAIGGLLALGVILGAFLQYA